MSVREERLILTAAALIGMGRDDRHSPDSAAAYAVARADACLSRLDETEPEEDSDGDITDSEALAEDAYEEGFRDAETKARKEIEDREAEIKGLRAELAAATAPKPTEPQTKPSK